MAYAKETGREGFFFFCSSKSLCGERMKEKEKKKNVLKECCRC